MSSNTLVEWNGGGYRSPFIASGVLLVLAWIVIRGTWGENYGGGGGAQVSTDDIFQIKRLGAAWKIVAAGTPLHSAGLTPQLNARPYRRPHAACPRAHTDNI